MRVHRLFSSLLLVLLTACGPQSPPPLKLSPFPTATKPAFTPGDSSLCTIEEIGAYVRAAKPLRDAFHAQLRTAQTTSRITLEPQIAELERIEDDAIAVAVPACLGSMHDLLLTGMNGHRTSLRDFLEEKVDDAERKAQFIQAQTALDNYDNAFIDMTDRAAPAPTLTPKK